MTSLHQYSCATALLFVVCIVVLFGSYSAKYLMKNRIALQKSYYLLSIIYYLFLFILPFQEYKCTKITVNYGLWLYYYILR